MDSTKLGTNLKKLRSSVVRTNEDGTRTNGMTQKEFAEYVGCATGTISAYEKGAISPSLEVAMQIAKKCNVSLDWLCGLSDSQECSIQLETYADWIKIINLLLECDFLKTDFGWIETTPNNMVEFYDSEFHIALTFDNKICERILKEWNQYRNVGDNPIMRENINKMWLQTILAKYKDWSIKTQIPIAKDSTKGKQKTPADSATQQGSSDEG